MSASAVPVLTATVPELRVQTGEAFLASASAVIRDTDRRSRRRRITASSIAFLAPRATVGRARAAVTVLRAAVSESTSLAGEANLFTAGAGRAAPESKREGKGRSQKQKRAHVKEEGAARRPCSAISVNDR